MALMSAFGGEGTLRITGYSNIPWYVDLQYQITPFSIRSSAF